MRGRGDGSSAEEIDVEEVERLAGWASTLGPTWERDDMRSEARLRVLEALDSGCTAGLGRVAYRGAMTAFRGATYMAGNRMARTAHELGASSVRLLPHDGDWRATFRDAPEASPWGNEPGGASTTLGPVLDRLVDELAARGVSRFAVTEAILALADAAGRVRASRSEGVRSRVADLPARAMADRSGLTAAQCAALKALVLGERSRSDRNTDTVPGLVARAHSGEEVWSDARVVRMMDAIVASKSRLVHPWAASPDQPTRPCDDRMVS